MFFVLFFWFGIESDVKILNFCQLYVPFYIWTRIWMTISNVLNENLYVLVTLKRVPNITIYMPKGMTISELLAMSIFSSIQLNVHHEDH